MKRPFLTLELVSKYMRYDRKTDELYWTYLGPRGRKPGQRVATKSVSLEGYDYARQLIVSIFNGGTHVDGRSQKRLVKPPQQIKPLVLVTTELTAERLREVLRYEPKLKKFVWLEGRHQGSVAGSAHGAITVDGVTYPHSPLVELYANPDGTVYRGPIVGKLPAKLKPLLITWPEDNRMAKEEPEPTPPPKPRLKENPNKIAERLRALGVPEKNITQHLSGLKNVENKPRCPRTLEEQRATMREANQVLRTLYS